MLLINYLSETGRSTIISISSLIILIIESIPFGIILNLVAELGQLCNIDLRFGLSTICLLLQLPQIIEFRSMLTFEEMKGFVILCFPFFIKVGFLRNRLVTKTKTKHLLEQVRSTSHLFVSAKPNSELPYYSWPNSSFLFISPKPHFPFYHFLHDQ